MSSLSFFPSFYCYCRYSIWWRRYCCYQFRLLLKNVWASLPNSRLLENSWSPSIHWNVNYGKSRQLIFPFTDGVFLFHKKFYYILTGRWREWRDTIEERRHIRFWELSFQVNWWEKSINRGRILSFRCVRDKHRHMAALVYAHIHSLSPYLPASMAFVERRESKKENIKMTDPIFASVGG